MLAEEDIDVELDVSDKGYEVETPSGGTSRILKIYRTKPLPIFKIDTEDGKSLRAAKHHLLYTASGWKYIYECKEGMYIGTKDGMQEVVSCKEDGTEACYDIEVDNGQHWYYSNGIVSHNSTTFVARQLAYAHVIPEYSSLYVAPHHSHLDTYADRYASMEALWRTPVGKQLKNRKKYGRSKVELIYCGESALSARGKTVDEVLIDEAQSFDASILEDVLYTMTTSKIKSTVFAGTALTIDTLLESKWQDSSMGIWHVRAGDGKTWLNMYDQDTLFKVCSSPQGPTCPITGKLLDVTNGYYVHAHPDALAAGRVGLHVPQCIIPDLAYDPIQWMDIYTKVKRTDPKKVMQECFGIAVAMGSREITERDLMRLCTITETEEELKERCKTGYYRFIVSGCDWGGSDYNQAARIKTSYTVHCILGLAPDDSVHILHYKRYAGMDYPDIAESILRDHKDFNGQFIANDFGVGAVYNMLIRKQIPFDRHFIFCYVGPKTPPLAEPKNQHMNNQLSLNKTEAITAVFSAVKSLTPQKIHCRGWGEMQTYLDDWLNLFRVPTDSDTDTRFKYVRNATKTDDALHAFTFAYVLIRFFMGEPLVHDPTLQARLRELLNSPQEHITPKVTFNLDDLLIHG